MNATKVKAIVSLVIWLVVGAIAVNAFFLMSQGGSWISFPATDPDAGKPLQVLSDRSTSADIDTLIIEWSVGGVTLHVGEEGSGIRVIERSRSKLPENKQVQLDQNGSTLTLRSRNKTHFVLFGWGIQFSYLDVIVEPKLYQRIKLTQASGVSEVVGVQADELELISSTGGMEINSVKATTLNLIQTSGQTTLFGDNQTDVLNMTMTSGKIDGRINANKVSVNMTSGDFSLRFISANPESLDHDMTSGSAAYGLPQDLPFSIDVNKTTGSFTSNFTMSLSGRIYSYGTGGPRYTLDMTSGSFLIRP